MSVQWFGHYNEKVSHNVVMLKDLKVGDKQIYKFTFAPELGKWINL